MSAQQLRENAIDRPSDIDIELLDALRARDIMRVHMEHAEALALEAESRVDRGSLLMKPSG